MYRQRPKRPGEGAFGIILLLLGLVFFWQSYKIAGLSALSSPGAFPLAASAVMVLAALVVVINDLRRPHTAPGGLVDKARSFSTEITPSVVAIFAGTVIGYAALLDVLGFLPASLLFLFVTIQFLHRGSVLFNLLIALGSLVVIYIVFRLVFTVVLPEGLVPEREILAWFEQLFTGGAAQ